MTNAAQRAVIFDQSNRSELQYSLSTTCNPKGAFKFTDKTQHHIVTVSQIVSNELLTVVDLFGFVVRSFSS